MIEVDVTLYCDVTVLRSLACVADDSKVTDANLARIVAVAEREVGNGWKADPDVEVVGSAWVLMTMFTDHDPRYEIGLAPAAARYDGLEVVAWTHEGVRHERQRCCPTREVTR